MSLKNAFVKVAIVLVPSYTMAYLTEMMVYVVPLLAASSFFASSVELGHRNICRRVDEDEADDATDDNGLNAEVVEILGSE